MKKFLIIILALLVTGQIHAQSRKYISQFSHMQSYYNPGLTGYEGSAIRGFVRNQWAGWEGAPKTYFVSAEVDFGQLSGEGDPALLGKNAASINMFQDSYGAFRETELILAYASRIRISKSANLRFGAGINYNTVRLDGSSMTTEQANDPKIAQYMNGFANMQVLDFNLGLALTHNNYYLSYGVHNVNKGQFSRGDVFMERKPTVNIVQAGYRNRLSENLSIATNFMFRSQFDLPDNIEFNFKALLMDRIWIGAGHRIDYANNFQFGIILPMLRLGYVYELPMSKTYLLPNTTHEFMAVFPLFRKNAREESNQVLIW